MIYNLPRKKAKFEETWVIKQSPDDEDGYCVKMTTGSIPEDVAAKLAELNK